MNFLSTLRVFLSHDVYFCFKSVGSVLEDRWFCVDSGPIWLERTSAKGFRAAEVCSWQL